jgi:DNA-binding IclR family transcriptional regulator
MMTDTGTHLVKSARRVLEVLEYFDRENPSATVTEIARALSYPQSSTSVLLRCLRQLGYLYYNRFHRTYRLTARAALIGCWAEDANFRGGKMIRLVDAVAEQVDQTVSLSANNCDYQMYHVHVVRGSSPEALPIRSGDSEPVLHSAPGELALASYPEPQARLALHRLNADQEDPALRVNVNDKLAELRVLRDRGWTIRVPADSAAPAVVAVLMPRRKGADRLTLSVVAPSHVIAERGEEFLKIILAERDRIFVTPPRWPAPLPAETPAETANDASPRSDAWGEREGELLRVI